MNQVYILRVSLTNCFSIGSFEGIVGKNHVRRWRDSKEEDGNPVTGPPLQAWIIWQGSSGHLQFCSYPGESYACLHPSRRRHYYSAGRRFDWPMVNLPCSQRTPPLQPRKGLHLHNGVSSKGAISLPRYEVTRMASVIIKVSISAPMLNPVLISTPTPPPVHLSDVVQH